MEIQLSKNQIVTMLAKSSHGKLEEYIQPFKEAYNSDPEFLSHLMTWNTFKGSIRDSKIALPFLFSIERHATVDDELMQNALALIALLTPLQIMKKGLRGFVLNKSLKGMPAYNKVIDMFRPLIVQYIYAREKNKNWWTYTALQFRKDFTDMYSLFGVRPHKAPQRILFHSEGVKGQPGYKEFDDYPEDSVFYHVKHMHEYSASQIKDTILEYKIPFLVNKGALGGRLKEEDVLFAVVETMSPTELTTNAKFLEKLGVKNTAATRGAFSQSIKKAAKSSANMLKTTQAAKALAEDDPDDFMVQELQNLQEKQIQHQKGIEGDWAVAIDKSGSMSASIELGCFIGATLAKMVKGKILLLFFDNECRGMDVTGKTYEEILTMVRHIQGGGGTDMSLPFRWLKMNKVDVGGTVFVSDGGDYSHSVENHYQAYVQFVGKDIPVYFYKIQGSDGDRFSTQLQKSGQLQMFDLTKGAIDYYALPNIVATMRTNSFSLIQEVYDTPLLTLEKTLQVPRRFR